MISLEPLLLAGEIVQQVVAIVLTGVVIVQLVQARRLSEPHAVRSIVLILVALVISTIASILDYFVADNSPLFSLFLYIPVALLMPFLFWFAIKYVRTKAMTRAFLLLVIVEASILIACIARLALGSGGAWFDTVRIAAEVAETFVLYFLVLLRCMRLSRQ